MRDRIDNMCHFVANNELNILFIRESSTFAANSSPINNPSFILTGPRVTS